MQEPSGEHRIKRLSTLPAALLIPIFLASAAETQDAVKTTDAKPKIAQVFFAQQHVHATDHPLFKLVDNLEALIKVQVYADTPRRSPVVLARLTLGSKTLELPLKGPANLPKPPTGDPLLMEHKYEDSFTAVIPREWIKPGLKVTVESREQDLSGNATVLDHQVYDKLNIGAPTRLIMTMFDFHFFGGAQGADYPKGWFEELGSKLPVAELELRRVRNIVFDKLVMPPREGKPATLCGSREEYQKKTGMGFDGEQGMTGNWRGALREANGGGWGGTRRVYFGNIYGVPCGGTGGGLAGVGNGRQQGILLHELGHAFGLPHWAGKEQYPYVGPMHGIQAPGSETMPHVGPTWAFDLVKRAFISPTQDGAYKKDPMQGGGAGDGKPYLYKQFSDYSVSRIRDTFEKTQVVWDERAGHYAQWDPKTGLYTIAARKRGSPTVPIEDDIEVISVLASASLVTSEANIVYPPIGPYKAGRIEIFDASDPASRSRARGAGYDDSKCNLCLRVTQGEKVRSYLVKDGLDPKNDPAKTDSFAVFAISLPARDGEVTQVDLLHTPGVMGKGVVSDCKVLYSWKAASPPTHKTEFVTALYPTSAEIAASATSAAAKSPGDMAKTGGAPRSSVVPKPVAAPRVIVPEDVLAEWSGRLKQRIAASAKAGKPLRGWVNAGGKEGTYPLVGADENKLEVQIGGNAMPVPWSWLKQKDLLSLVKSLAKDDDAESLLMLSVFLFVNGQMEAGETTLARAELLDAPAATKVYEQLKWP